MENSTVEPGGGSCARWFLGMGGGYLVKVFFEKTFTRFYYRPAWQAHVGGTMHCRRNAQKKTVKKPPCEQNLSKESGTGD